MCQVDFGFEKFGLQSDRKMVEPRKGRTGRSTDGNGR